MKTLPVLGLAALLALPVAVPAAPLDPKIIPALMLSAGRTHSRRDESGLGSGFFLDANYTRTFINVGGAYKSWENESLTNIYVGTGLGKVLQLQAGFGTEESVFRVRHDLNLTSLYDFFTGTRRNRYQKTIENRVTFTVSAEHYGTNEKFDNFQIGFGLQY